MWNAFVQHRNGGGYDERALQFIELSDDDCKLLVAAGLKIQKGASPRDLYCFQNLPAYYDGTPLQVLRLLEEARSAGRMTRRAEAVSHQTTTKRQRLSSSYGRATSGLLPAWATADEGVLMEGSETENPAQLPEVIKIAPSSVKRLPSPAKGSNSGRAVYHKVSSPVKPSLATPTKDTAFQSVSPATRRSHRTSMKIDIVSVQEETPSATSSRKRKSESASGATSTSPLGALFSPKSIRTPSPGIKTQRSSVLKQFETPEQPTGSGTPQTVPAPPKRFSTTTTQYTVTTTTTSDVDDDNDELSDGLVDDAPEDDERACCDVKSVVEPIMEALHRTSSRFQEAWEEYSKVTPTSTKASKAK